MSSSRTQTARRLSCCSTVPRRCASSTVSFHFLAASTLANMHIHNSQSDLHKRAACRERPVPPRVCYATRRPSEHADAGSSRTPRERLGAAGQGCAQSPTQSDSEMVALPECARALPFVFLTATRLMLFVKTLLSLRMLLFF